MKTPHQKIQTKKSPHHSAQPKVIFRRALRSAAAPRRSLSLHKTDRVTHTDRQTCARRLQPRARRPAGVPRPSDEVSVRSTPQLRSALAREMRSSRWCTSDRKRGYTCMLLVWVSTLQLCEVVFVAALPVETYPRQDQQIPGSMHIEGIHVA